MFGTQFVYGNPATSLATDGDLRIVGLADGSAVTSRAVVIATGVSYRQLTVPGLESLAGAGVFYGAATTEAQALTGKRAFVVGGGNSAGQAALHVSRYAQHVTILVRSASLAASMSQYLIREIEAAPSIDVRYRTEVAGGGGDGRLEQLRLRHRDPGAGTLPARNQHTRRVRRRRRAARLGETRSISRRRRGDRCPPGARLPCVKRLRSAGA